MANLLLILDPEDRAVLRDIVRDALEASKAAGATEEKVNLLASLLTRLEPK